MIELNVSDRVKELNFSKIRDWTNKAKAMKKKC